MWKGQKGVFPTGLPSALLVVRFGKRPSVLSTLHRFVCMHLALYLSICVSMFVYKGTSTRALCTARAVWTSRTLFSAPTHTHTHTYTYIYTHTYIYRYIHIYTYVYI